MRTLALRLDSGTATLYRHVAGRTELIAHVVDRVFGEVRLDAVALPSMSWQESCRAVAGAMDEALRKHGNVTPLLVGLIPMGPNAMEIRERCLAVLLDNGFGARMAARSWATLAHYVLGFAIQRHARDAAREIDPGRVSDDFRGLPASEFPATVAVAHELPVPLEVEFAFGLDLIINGLSQVHSAHP